MSCILLCRTTNDPPIYNSGPISHWYYNNVFIIRYLFTFRGGIVCFAGRWHFNICRAIPCCIWGMFCYTHFAETIDAETVFMTVFVLLHLWFSSHATHTLLSIIWVVKSRYVSLIKQTTFHNDGEIEFHNQWTHSSINKLGQIK